jgi:acetate kinase
MKYGFHGLSYQFLVQQLPEYNDGELPEKLIIAHLGNGASACAIKNGQSINCTMNDIKMLFVYLAEGFGREECF